MHRALLPLLIAAALMLAASGCSGGSDGSAAPADDSPLTSAELGWIRAYSAWTFAIHDDELGAPVGPQLVAACRDRLEEVGASPTKRLEPAADHAATACPLLAEKGAHRRALDIIETADDLLRPLLRDEQPLQLRTGATEASRADTSFSELASAVVGYPLEVRCWGDSDWRRVVNEDNAWTDSGDDAETLLGWTDESADRIHMRLEDCNALDRLRRGVFRTLSRTQQIDSADSLGTLAHEVRHFVLPDADEATVECAAMRSLRRLGERVGLDRSSAIAIAELYRTEI